MIRSLLFLDFDGVLNTHEAGPPRGARLDPVCVRLLNGFLAKTAPHAAPYVVVTSSWRNLVHCKGATLASFRRMLWEKGLRLPADFALTPPTGHQDHYEPPETRAGLILAWLARNPPGGAPVAILDDLDLAPHLGPYAGRLLRTDPRFGLTERDAAVLRALLWRGPNLLTPANE